MGAWLKFPSIYIATITREDLLRLLPMATGEADFREAGDLIAGRHWRIRLTPVDPLVIGSLQLDRYRVEHEFSGLSEQEVDAFMTRFGLHLQRGGG